MRTRPTCARCAIKHLAQARVLMLEVRKGYPLHVYYAIGHMSEAEDELIEQMPDEANRIRSERLKLEEGLRTGRMPAHDWAALMLMIAEGAMLEETLYQGAGVAVETQAQGDTQ